MSHYKGVYRLRTEWDKNTKMFPREYTGQFAENDVYIDCYNDCRIFHYGGRILEYYCPSLQRGHNIIKSIKSQFQGEEIIYNIVETSSEVMFRFNAKDIERLEPLLKPKTSGADRSPFSNKNLPKNKDYKIPDEYLEVYKELVSKLPKNQMILLSKYTNSFLQSLVTKKNTWEDIKADMALKGLKGKEYIYSINKWTEYISYLERNIK